ncbi:alanyl-tRNA synthetase [Nitrosospira multiformis ATCC 25196]|uniref:Alanine--tRNA ligase n=2 Tax=Nitrosospira multiformis (strain ATCC 25196 / NCIMB 11849 / C 71) TaxID=323848 RepID=SYA_NITMU|nr:alanine--tRNA ligase [Nitrosospira multiformis]Q2YD40.1 RecName: Full=Alanine--tRNA ligase; AltName: Full=Alanyl-tRNA synthetase; Short=AlaRS [Nitrosospira multiformis ATCC 25196]ABB73331.1 alanyl-tRNA synthetase [Nitrosospira multiformis ATCC 25196]SEG01640.1 alanyl-tRNA synthetase [Nitrosospira multiformis ATCC 25196]
MKSSEVRQKFLEFFETHGHTIVPSSPLVPGNDPTLLFTNAGMVQFKDVFLGQDKRPYVRAASAQRCVRAGGKHNDLENVGYTARHHTFFEMLGNFSFGDYFKRNAIRFAWEFLTDILKIPRERLWITVYAEDDEAADIWLNEVGIDSSRFTRIATQDNFWQMGDTGPCGPCSEIFYDHGPEIPGGPPGTPNADGDRYVEIWNLVFMQYNRDSAGTLHPLPRPSVDTGMGLERISAVMQQVHSNYEIDLFQQLIKAAARATNTTDLSSSSLNVIADHIRACSFLIADGVIPGNEGRGYVLRRIIRRAIRHGYKLGQKQPFFHQLVEDLASVMGQAYPELMEAKTRVSAVLKQEEERFAETLENGMQVLEAALRRGDRMLDGETLFRLYDTFGFPLDLTADIARERGIAIDEAGFDQAMEQQRERARTTSKFIMQEAIAYSGPSTTFHGYESLRQEGQVLAIYKEGSRVEFIEAGDEAVIVLDKTPFYAESGGQVGDSGELLAANGTFAVADTQKIQADVFGHKGLLRSGRLATGDAVLAEVDRAARARTERNHSVTHLMHKALREVLGHHVQQKGSLVDANKTRFDFAHNQPVTDAEIRKVEMLVNAEILANAATEARMMAIEDAKKSGAMMLFGEKYSDEVRVLDIGTSRELCGGTHVKRTGDIGLFKIVAESGVAAGVRRVEAVTGERALTYIQEQELQLQRVAAAVKAQPQDAAARITQILDNVKHLERELGRMKSKLASSQGDDFADRVREIKGVKVLAVCLEEADPKTLREAVDKFKNKFKSCVTVLAAVEDGKVKLIAGVTSDLTARLKAGDLVNFVAQQVGGKGGGRADLAQAGGTVPDSLPAALESVASWVEQHL